MEVVDVLHSIGYSNLGDFGTHFRTNPLYRVYRSQNSLAIKKQTGEWFDHSERVGGTLATLVQKTMNLDTVEQVKAYMGDLPIVVSTRDSVELTEIKKFDKTLLLKLVKDNSYWHSRGVSDRILNQFNGGVADNGRMKGRYVFPIFDDRGDLIGFSGRLIYASDTLPKWKHIGQKKNFVFPFQAMEHILRLKEAIIVESIGDLLKLMECGIFNVIVSFGVDLSPKIVQQLIKFDVSRIIIALNNDEDGGFVGNEAAEEYKTELLNNFDADQIIISLPPAKDFGVMNCEAITEWKNNICNEDSDRRGLLQV